MGMSGLSKSKASLNLALIIATLIISIGAAFSMSLNPYHNGTYPEHRNQYEELSEALMHGHIYLHEDEDVSALLAMEDCYDFAERERLGISFEWDHAFYNGHYYMYFGIVPELLLFLPFRAITGHVLPGWIGTAIFAVLSIIGLSLLISSFGKKYKNSLHTGGQIALLFIASAILLWYPSKYPSLYCTPIIAAVCLLVWMLYFALKGVFFNPGLKIRYLLLAAICGALVFGCRPPMAISELILIPLLPELFKRIRGFKRGSMKLRAIASIIVPYIIVAAGLMWYNHARFGSFFEFGQAYQLTFVNQSSYNGNVWERITAREIFLYIKDAFISLPKLSPSFPYVSEYAGIFIMFPVLILALVPSIKADKRLKGLHIALLLAPVLIVISQCLFSPWWHIRYACDFSILLIMAMILSAYTLSSALGKKGTAILNRALIVMAAITVLTGLLLFAAPGGLALADLHPNVMEKLDSIISFWK